MADEIDVPPPVRALRLLDGVDYEDAFRVANANRQCAEWWMRSFVQGAPLWFAAPWTIGGGLLFGKWFTLTGNSIRGWPVVSDSPDAFVVGFNTRRGLNVRMAAITPPDEAVIVTQIQLTTGYAKRVWPSVQAGHRYFAPFLLDRAAQRPANARVS